MDKQFLLMGFITLIAVVGGLGFGPFVALVVYYMNAVLRPQNLWMHVASVRETSWSLYTALVAILSAFLYRLGLVGYASSGATRGAKVPVWNAVHWSFLFFAIWITIRYTLTTFYGEPVDVKRSDQIFNEYYKMFVMWIVASLVIYRLSQLWFLLAVIALAAAYVGLEANMIYFRFRYNSIQRNGFGGLDNNGAGLMLAMAIPLCYFLWEGTRNRFRWVYLACIPFLVHAVMLTFSRGAMLSTIVCTPVIFLFSRHKRFLLVLGGLACAGVIATAGPELRERFLSVKQHDLDASANERKTTWRIAAMLATDNPFFGLGLRCSQRHVGKYGAAENQAIHSQYFQLAVDAGWVGMGLFVVLVGTTIWTCYRFWWATRKWPSYPEVNQARALAGAVSSSIVLYSFGAIFLSLDNFEMPYILFMIVAQMWGVYKGGGIQALAWANGSLSDPKYAALNPNYRKPPNPLVEMYRQVVPRRAPYPGNSAPIPLVPVDPNPTSPLTPAVPYQPQQPTT